MNKTKTTILVVEDDEMMAHAVKAKLKSLGYNVIMASEGEEGLEKAKKNAPDLIITDVVMPKMDGHSFVRHLRAHPRLSCIPVIFLSSLDSAGDRLKGFQLGADDYLPKPLRMEELEYRVKNVFQRFERIQASVFSESQPTSKPVEDSSGDTTFHLLTKGKPASFQGNLEDLGLSSIMSIISMERMSGLLSVISADKKKGIKIFLEKGKVVKVRYGGPERLKNLNAIYEILKWKEGKFTFDSHEEVEPEISASVDHILLEAARQMDESQKRPEDF